MNRKRFIQVSSSAALSFAALPYLASCKQTKKQTRLLFEKLTVNEGSLQAVRGNVSSFTNRGGTVGLLETNEGFVVIDAQFPNTIKPLIKSLTEKDKPITVLCNTHHHGDHTAGNTAFEGKVNQIVAQTQVPIYQKKRAEESDNLDEQVYANLLFDKKHTIELGNETVTGYHYGAGHTYGDAIYHFETDNVVHMGDLIFNKTIPVYRVKDGSNSEQWIQILDQVLEQFDDDTQFIFGHSYEPELTTGTKDDLRDMKSFLEASHEHITKQINLNLSEEEIINNVLAIPNHEDRKTLWDSHWQDFIINFYQSLKK